MSGGLAVELRNVTKSYRRYAYRRKFATLKSAILKGSLASDLKPNELLAAVSGVSFQVPAGSAFGIVGRNGSGKSTMLKLIAGITKPTSGTITVDGRISALIELGAGFHPEISGRENVFINGVMLGLTKREITRRFDEIVEFAELEDFIDAPVKTYSSGMYMRLGFAVAVHVDPDILIVDEVLAVGDEGFSLKCIDKFSEFKRRGKTILLVTHGLSMVERFCDEAVWLEKGAIRGEGDPRRVIHAYVNDVEKAEEALLTAGDKKMRDATVAGDGSGPVRVSDQPISTEAPPEDMFRAAQGRWGLGPVEITDVTLESAEGASHVFHSGDAMTIRLKVHTPEPVDDFVFGISIFNAEGINCYGTNTYIEEMRPETMSGDGEVAFTIDHLDLVEGTYKLDVAAHKRDGAQYDYHRLLYTFRVKSHTKDAGIYRPRHRWTFSPNITFKVGATGPEL
jgi:ABC-type polysaccharide/polyol phosphate transport system ATPase subunit